MTKVEVACFFLGWGLLVHGLYQLSPVAMEIALALQFIVMSAPGHKGTKQ